MGKNNIKTFDILKCKPVDELFYLFELLENVDYEIVNINDSYDVYRVSLKYPRAIDMYECIKDITIYVPRLKLYLEYFLFPTLERNPIIKPSVIRLFDVFAVDDLFAYLMSDQKLAKIQNKRKTNSL